MCLQDNLEIENKLITNSETAVCVCVCAVVFLRQGLYRYCK